MAPQSAIMRSLLAYVRTQEDQADHAGVKFLNATGQSPKGMVELFKRLSNEVLFNSRYIDPYMQTHPMPADRVAALETLAKQSPYWDRKDPPELQLRHDMMRAKLSGFLERADTVARRYPSGDHSLPARYARAISTYRNSDLRQALVQIDGLIQVQPNNPYFYELKGQALLEGGRPAEAVAPLRQAVQLSHSNPLIEILLAQALNATNNPKLAEEAVGLLRTAIVREPEAPEAYSQLAMAYALQAMVSEGLKPLLPGVITFGAGHFYISQSDKGGLVFGGDIDMYASYAARGNLPMVEHVMEAGMTLMPMIGRAKVLRS